MCRSLISKFFCASNDLVSLLPVYLSHLTVYNVICRKMQRVRFCSTRSARKLKLLRKITLVCGTLTKRMGRYFILSYWQTRTHCCGHIVADTNVSRLTHAHNICRRHKFVRDTKNVSDFVQKHFVSAANVFQFLRARKHHEQQCVCNTVSSFASTFKMQLHFPNTVESPFFEPPREIKIGLKNRGVKPVHYQGHTCRFYSV